MPVKQHDVLENGLDNCAVGKFRKPVPHDVG